MNDIQAHFGSALALEELLTEALENFNLTAWEADFIQDMSDRLSDYGDGCYCSDKQAETIRTIMDKYA